MIRKDNDEMASENFRIENGVLIEYTGNDENVTIPNGVTEIGRSAFSGCKSLKSITIPDGVTTIGFESFKGCTSLTGIVIPDSVYYLEYGAFRDCTSLTEVIISDNVKKIDSVFVGCNSLKSVTLGKKLDEVNDFAFFRCDKLINVTIKNQNLVNTFKKWANKSIRNVVICDGVTNIGKESFYKTYIESITIPGSVTEIESGAFKFCSYLKKVCFNGTLEDWLKIMFSDSDSNPCRGSLYLNGELLTEAVIPDSIKEIGAYAFSASGITSVTIPDSVTVICMDAFGNTDIKTVTIPGSVKEIRSLAFIGCKQLESITISHGVSKIYCEALKDCKNLKKVYYTGTLEDWLKIDFKGFHSNPCYVGTSFYIGGELLTEAIIPDGVTNISNEAFIKCRSLANVTIPGSVTEIGTWAFSDCDNLKNVTINEGVSTIGYGAFEQCTSLTSVTIPDSVNTIDKDAFSNCTSLDNITLESSKIKIDNSFKGCKNLKTVKYSGTLEDWLKLDFNSPESNPCRYGASLYINGELLTEVIIPNSITKIGRYAFYGCTSLINVTIPDGISEICKDAFYNCSNIKSVKISESVKKIGDDAFSGCSELEYLEFPGGGVSIREKTRIFSRCPKLQENRNPNFLKDNYLRFARVVTSDEEGAIVVSVLHNMWIKETEVDDETRERIRRQIEGWYIERKEIITVDYLDYYEHRCIDHEIFPLYDCKLDWGCVLDNNELIGIYLHHCRTTCIFMLDGKTIGLSTEGDDEDTIKYYLVRKHND